MNTENRKTNTTVEEKDATGTSSELPNTQLGESLDSTTESNSSEPGVSEETVPASSAGDEKKSGRKKNSSSGDTSGKEKQGVKAKPIRVTMKLPQKAIDAIKAGISTPVTSRDAVVDIVKSAISALTPEQIIFIINDYPARLSPAKNTNMATESNVAYPGESDEE